MDLSLCLCYLTFLRNLSEMKTVRVLRCKPYVDVNKNRELPNAPGFTRWMFLFENIENYWKWFLREDVRCFMYTAKQFCTITDRNNRGNKRIQYFSKQYQWKFNLVSLLTHRLCVNKRMLFLFLTNRSQRSSFFTVTDFQTKISNLL